MTQSSSIDDIRDNIRSLYSIEDLEGLLSEVQNISDLYWFLKMTGLIPGLNKASFITLMKINGVEAEVLDPSAEFSQTLEKLSDTGVSKELRPSDILEYLKDSISSEYTLSDHRQYLLERVRSFEDLRQFLCVIEDVTLYDGMDTLDLMVSLMDSEWSTTDDVSAQYAAAWSKVRAIIEV